MKPMLEQAWAFYMGKNREEEGMRQEFKYRPGNERLYERIASVLVFYRVNRFRMKVVFPSSTSD
jgi:hypothetical protein